MNIKHDWPVERALISVSDKSGLLALGKGLQALGIEIISTGGTARALMEAAIPVTEVSDYTGFPEMMDGRLKTLHPKVHGGLLGRLDLDGEVMAANRIAPIGLVVVNLYPFEQTVAHPDCDLAHAIENIDIGGPAMLRGGAKNHAYCGVVVNPADYPAILDELKSKGRTLSADTRFDLAVKAFEHTARYDGAIANYLGCRLSAAPEPFPRSLSLQFQKIESLRYGENPHQKAAYYREPGTVVGTVVGSIQKQGKALSFNNIADADAALECVKQFAEPACVIVKHANPCGVALGETIAEAYELAYSCDSTSAFGGVIAFNRPLDEDTVGRIVDRQFVELIIAPGVADAALLRASRKKDVRILDCGKIAARPSALDLRRISGGLLVQDADEAVAGRDQLKQVTARAPDGAEVEDMLFAWRVAKYVKSNTIIYVKGKRTLGIGAGQMSRVDSAKIAISKATEAGLSLAGAVMASDAFFPFRDGIDAAHAAGIKAVIQPGGSMKDQEVIAAADEYGIAMMFTGERHFRH